MKSYFMRLTVVFALTLAFAGFASAGTEDMLFEAGSKAYLEGDWVSALEKWKEIERQGFSGGPLFYNLGNAYYKQGELGEAILYWEKAAKIMGEDGDIALNLKIARSRLQDKLDVAVRLPVWNWLDQVRDRFSAALVAWISVVLSFLLFGSLAVRRWVVTTGRGKARMKPLSIGIGAALGICLAIIALKAGAESSRREGILLTREAEVLSAPALGSGKLLFTLHEGTKVRVVRHLEGWYEVQADREKQGWVKEDAVGVI